MQEAAVWQNSLFLKVEKKNVHTWSIYFKVNRLDSFVLFSSASRGSKRPLSISPFAWRRKALCRWWIFFVRTGQTSFACCICCRSWNLYKMLQGCFWWSLPPSVDAVCAPCSNCLEKKTAEGNTALHHSVLYHKPESLKLLLKAKAAIQTGHFTLLIRFQLPRATSEIIFFFSCSEFKWRDSSRYR